MSYDFKQRNQHQQLQFNSQVPCRDPGSRDQQFRKTQYRMVREEMFDEEPQKTNEFNEVHCRSTQKKQQKQNASFTSELTKSQHRASINNQDFDSYIESKNQPAEIKQQKIYIPNSDLLSTPQRSAQIHSTQKSFKVKKISPIRNRYYQCECCMNQKAGRYDKMAQEMKALK